MGDNTSDRDDPKSEKQHDALDWLNFVILVLAMLAATFAAVYTGQEVKVAKKTLKVAGDTLKEVREGTRNELRAYVSAFPYHHVNGVAPGVSPHTAAMIKNTGQTPAWDVSFKAKLVAENEPPEPTISNFTGLTSRRADTYLAPTVQVGAADTFNIDRPLTVEDFEAVKTGESARFYAWGVVAYTDVFGKPHHSYFCFIYFGYKQSPDTGMGSIFRDFCPHPRND